ncbi:efflux RND transporter permease subunit [Noviherbaspirillum sp.]|uniref:efflux RND transporter permease subunit n=1 Tax=Noviherbaspirillum sp. TaxID=1926288 RepID=UPI002FE0CBED
MKHDASFVDFPVLHRLQDFDPHSGSPIERVIFNHRSIVLILCLLAIVVLGARATRLTFNASFENMLPMGHPYIVNYLAHREGLSGLGNTVRIAVETTQGTIFDASYLEALRRINDAVFLLPGVDRPYMKSLWTPSVRWVAVTEEGLDGGPLIPDTYDGSSANIAQVRANIERSGEIGRLVAANQRSTVIVVPLLEKDHVSGQALDYGTFSNALETIRTQYQTATLRIHITGFAKVAGDLIEGLGVLLLFFILSVCIAASLLYWHTRCVRSTLLVVSCSLVAVVCLLGLLPTPRHTLDPYSMLVLFLVFAIGMSHGAQKMNGIMQDIGRGTHRVVAARYCFRRLFLAGLTALLADAAGFAVLTVIPIRTIQDMALTASIGVAILIVTNLVLVPVQLSYVGVSASAARRSIRRELAAAPRQPHAGQFLELLTRKKYAGTVIAFATVLGIAGLAASSRLSIGDVDPGAPELRPDSRYNRDNAFMTANYATSSDILAVMVKTPQFKCVDYDVLLRMDALEWQLQQLPGVISTQSFAGLSKWLAVGMNEGNPKWYDLSRNQDMLNAFAARAPQELFSQTCDLLPLYVYLQDHKADTLTRVTAHVESFAGKNNTDDAEFLLAAGNAGIEAATNAVVKRFHLPMLALVYSAAILLCLITFRSWRAVFCAIVPLVLAAILCEAMMVMLGIGVKVATLPVIALGAGIGVDYGLYVLAVLLARLRAGMSLRNAYAGTILFTGRVVMLTGVMLAIATGIWVFSPIKFHADMGILLAFMFLWNLLGALVLLPALAVFLLGKEFVGEHSLQPSNVNRHLPSMNTE